MADHQAVISADLALGRFLLFVLGGSLLRSLTGVDLGRERDLVALGGPDGTFNGAAYDAFVAKVSADGTALVYAGYLGGSGYDGGYGIAVDSAGNAYVAGWTESAEDTFPVTVGPNLTYNGGDDAFVAKVRADGTALVYAGFIGGSDYEDLQVLGITVARLRVLERRG